MEFPFHLSFLRKQISLVNSETKCKEIEKLKEVIDEMGKASAKAQKLKQPITSYKKLLINPSHRIYILRSPFDKDGSASVVGILKVGLKDLYLIDSAVQHHEVTIRCVLDFYIEESMQRCGYGIKLFNYMLGMENLKPFEMAYDRPSDLCLQFLKNHFKLHDFIPQSNNYVLFKEYGLDNMDPEISQMRKFIFDKNFSELDLNNQNNEGGKKYEKTVLEKEIVIDKKKEIFQVENNGEELEDYNYFNQEKKNVPNIKAIKEFEEKKMTIEEMLAIRPKSSEYKSKYSKFV